MRISPFVCLSSISATVAASDPTKPAAAAILRWRATKTAAAASASSFHKPLPSLLADSSSLRLFSRRKSAAAGTSSSSSFRQPPPSLHEPTSMGPGSVPANGASATSAAAAAAGSATCKSPASTNSGSAAAVTAAAAAALSSAGTSAAAAAAASVGVKRSMGSNGEVELSGATTALDDGGGDGGAAGDRSTRVKIESNAENGSVLPRFPAPPHAAEAWARFRAMGSPRFHVAPMVDQSELPFRMLCRKYGADAAYTPMLHSRLFAEDPKYRKEFTTCEADRPLFVQFCANDPDTLVKAARLVADQCDYVDINFGCPQRIAKRGNYGAFLMDDLDLVRRLVEALAAANLPCLISCKIRVFPDLARTLAYARMIQDAGCSLLAVHGRTRDQKDQRAIRADWSAIRAVKAALAIPVIANGNVRHRADAEACLAATGADGVMSAESLLANPALFSGRLLRPLPPIVWGEGEGGGDAVSAREGGKRKSAEGNGAAVGPDGGERAAQAAPMEEKDATAAKAAQVSEGSQVLETGAAGLAPLHDGRRAEANGDTTSEVGTEGDTDGVLDYADPVELCLEYLALCETYPVPYRMVRAHLHRMLGDTFRRHPHVRERLNKQYLLTVPWLRELVLELKKEMEDHQKWHQQQQQQQLQQPQQQQGEQEQQQRANGMELEASKGTVECVKS